MNIAVNKEEIQDQERFTAVLSKKMRVDFLKSEIGDQTQRQQSFFKLKAVNSLKHVRARFQKKR